MSTDKERDYVASLYPGQGWKKKVKQMSDAQVTAIYIGKKMAEEQKPKESKPDAEPF